MKNKIINKSFMNKGSKEDDQIKFEPFSQWVGHYSQTLSYTAHRFFIDKGIESPDEYRDVVQCLLSAQEGEIVELVISSYGGVLESALNIVSAIRESSAVVRAIITGSCHSAASVIALACDEVVVFDFANMLCHSATFGSFGKTTEIVSHVKFLEKYLEDVAMDVYKDFLSEKEIKEMLNGKDFWFDANQIRERLELRAQIQEKENERMVKEMKKQQKELDAKEKTTKKVAKVVDKDPELGV